MQFALPALMLGLVCGQGPEARYQTANFVVQAPTVQVAKLVAETAENCRKDLVKLWLDDEPADWLTPCHINVAVVPGKGGGRTKVLFARGKVSAQSVDINGSLERLLKGPLPHELTHVVFAHYFGMQPPRWADEGGAILSEDGVQGDRQNRLFRKVLAEQRCFGLRRLLAMRQYPADITSLYAQGYSVSRFLVAEKNHKVFLAFVRQGLEGSWDDAVRDHYGFENVERLEEAWLGWVAKQSETVVRSEE